MPDQPAQTPRSGIQILIAWANEQDHWVRAIVSEVIAARRELPEQSIEAAYALLLAEKGLSDDPAPNVSPLSAEASPAENAEDLRLVRLSGLAGVNALATGQEIAFNHRLTVLFGENAAGKTGYVRVLKRVASVRSAQPILGDVRGSSSGKPHAAIDYLLSGVSQSLDWNDEAGVPPFTRMAIFDSNAVALHVDEDLTYVFTPGELALFLHVHRALDAVKTRLEREKNEAQAKAANPFLHRFPRDAVIYPKIETLGPSTSIQDLVALANVTPEEKDSLQVTRDRVEALQPRSADGRLQVATSDRDLYGALRDAAQAAASFPWEKFEAGVADVRRAEERYLAASKTAFAGVSEAGGTTGIVNRGSHPRWDTVKNLGGRINQLIQNAGSATGEAQTALVEAAYGEIRSWCEVVVEQELLAGVTQRYQPNVAMTRLPQIKPEKFVAARDVILPLFEKACRIMTAHSQPLETLAVRPTLLELKTDWAAGHQARDAYLK